jgi:alpha-galactosidase
VAAGFAAELLWSGRLPSGVVAGLVLLALSASVGAAEDQSETIPEAHAWAARAFGKPAAVSPTGKGLFVESSRHLVLRNRTWTNARLRLGDRTYDHGLYMDTPATVRVSLGEPAEEFTAEVGIDRFTGGGSARFHVAVDGTRVLSTPVLRSGDEAMPVKAPLNGAPEFVLEVDDAGDGINCDQCDWGDAAVRLRSGRTLFLDELPLFAALRQRRLAVPFSFRYDGRPSDEFLDQWEFTSRAETAAENPTQVLSYRDPATGLLVECTVSTYPDAAGVDWVLRLSNTGPTDTPLLEDVLPLDVADLCGAAVPPGAAVLRWSNGDRHVGGEGGEMPDSESFLPHDEPLTHRQPREFRSQGAFRFLPFFNLQAPGGGWILAVGWSGHWKAEFLHDTPGTLNVRAGMQTTRFRLRPGESVRTPRMVLFRWHGERMVNGHNGFRAMMLRHYVQMLDGQPALPPIAHNSAATVYLNRMRLPNEERELALIRRIAGLGCDTYWMDAYWYPQPWHLNVGNWYPRPEDFPHGLRPLGDAAHARGMKFVLWFIPPSVAPNTQWATKYPHFIHGGTPGSGGLWKMGDPEARQFLTDWVSERIREWGVDIYREDGSGLPPEEGPDRLGVAEMKHVEGLYRFWDDLHERNPGLLMDNCMGGGNRIDIETSPRGFYLWRSDLNDIGEGLQGEAHWPYMALADQVMVTGLSLYVPFHTGPVWDMSPYAFRSAMASGICLYGDVDRPGFPEERARQGIAELRELRPLFSGDVYPLIPLTASQADWYAYQLDRPDLGEGCALVFRRPESGILMYDIRLQGIVPGARYRVSLTGETYEQGPWREVTGQELIRPEVLIRERPGSALLRYKRLGAG